MGGIKRADIRASGTNILSPEGIFLLPFSSLRFASTPLSIRNPCSTSPPLTSLAHTSSVLRNPSSPLSPSSRFSGPFLRLQFGRTIEMKFGKRLGTQIEETLPEWRDKFLSYKDLKKRLKLIKPSSTAGGVTAGDGLPPSKRLRLTPPDGPAAADAGKAGGGENGGTTAATAAGISALMTAEEEGFISLLEAELDKFNTFFVEQEEEYIIRQKELQDRLRAAKDSREEMMKVRKEIVDFHGEMVLLENYSALNYTGLVKILKKYDKRTGALIRLPFIRRVLRQPFFTTDLLDQLIKECERMLDGLLPLPAAGASAGDEEASVSSAAGDAEGPGIPEMEEIELMEGVYMKRTVAALRVLREIRSGSSTVSIFSLPPLQTTGAEDRWPKIPVLEGQAAK